MSYNLKLNSSSVGGHKVQRLTIQIIHTANVINNNALEAIAGVGNIHVLKRDLITTGGSHGHARRVMFVDLLAVLSSALTFTLSFAYSAPTQPMPCNFSTNAKAQEAALLLISEIEHMANYVVVNIDQLVSGKSAEDHWTYIITFMEPIGT
eukprot:10159657-Ditylum_brightwellii.AAC.1